MYLVRYVFIYFCMYGYAFRYSVRSLFICFFIYLCIYFNMCLFMYSAFIDLCVYVFRDFVLYVLMRAFICSFNSLFSDFGMCAFSYVVSYVCRYLFICICMYVVIYLCNPVCRDFVINLFI